MIWDALVVGAGPAGSAAALVLARSGYETLVVERCALPRMKACGDAMTFKAARALDELGALQAVRAKARPVEHVRLEAGGRTVTVSVDCLTLARRTLDAVLLNLACAEGARVTRGQITAVEQAEDRVEVRLKEDGEPLRARFVILATGSAGAGRVDGRGPSPKSSFFALRGYAAPAGPSLREMMFSFSKNVPGGYAWLFPLPGGVVNVGVGTSAKLIEQGVNLRRSLDWFLRIGAVQDLLGPKSSDTLDGLKGGSIRCALRGRLPPVDRRVLAAGDAIGSSYPFTGEGISAALWTGQAAGEAVARALATNAPEQVRGYADRLARELAPRYRKYLVTERLMAAPAVLGFTVCLLSDNEWLRRLARRLSIETRDRHVEVH